MDKFLRNGVGLIEREFFEFVQDGGIGDDRDIEGVGDRHRQDTRIHRVRVQEARVESRRGW